MPQHLTILTGASRGMGLAMARLMLRPGHTLLCISRTAHATLPQEAATLSSRLTDIDDELMHLLERWEALEA